MAFNFFNVLYDHKVQYFGWMIIQLVCRLRKIKFTWTIDSLQQIWHIAVLEWVYTHDVQHTDRPTCDQSKHLEQMPCTELSQIF